MNMTTLPKWLRPPILTKADRIVVVIIIAFSFFVAEIAIGFRNRSLALIGDAFHILSDIIGYAVSLVAIKMGGNREAPEKFSYGYQRASLLGGFFNGSFLLALGVSIILQSIERFLEPTKILEPILIMAIGAAGIGSNVLMILVLGGHDHGGHSHGPAADEARAQTELVDAGHENHEHATDNHKNKGHGHDLNIIGVLLHVLGDALNSATVIVSAGIFCATGFVYADPIAAVIVGLIIIGTSYPLIIRSARYLLNSAPEDIDLKGVKADIETVTGRGSVHELHVWSLTQSKRTATVHIFFDDMMLRDFTETSNRIRECLHLWNIHIVTIQPEITVIIDGIDVPSQDDQPIALQSTCGTVCKPGCEEELCCG